MDSSRPVTISRKPAFRIESWSVRCADCGGRNSKVPQVEGVEDLVHWLALRSEAALHESRGAVTRDRQHGRATRAVAVADDERRRQLPFPFTRNARRRERIIVGHRAN